MPIINIVDNFTARYVRVTVSGADVYTGPWVSLTELRIFGDGEREDVAVSGVNLNVSTIELDEGLKQKITATISPTNATNKAITFSSSDATVASIDVDGLITAESGGTATITVTTEDGGFTASTQVTVISPVIPLNVKDDFSGKVVLSPNPATSTVSLKGVDDYHTLSVYDQSGRMIIHQKINDLHSLNVSCLLYTSPSPRD